MVSPQLYFAASAPSASNAFEWFHGAFRDSSLLTLPAQQLITAAFVVVHFMRLPLLCCNVFERTAFGTLGMEAML